MGEHTRKRVAVLISGRGSNMTALIDAAKAAVISGRDRARGVQQSGCSRTWSGAAAAGIVTATIDHRPFGKDREAFEHALQRVPRSSSHRSHLPRRLHAPAHGRVHLGVARPHDQHPPCPAPGVPRARHTRARTRCRGDHPRRHRPLRGPRNGCGTDYRAERPCRYSPATLRRRSPPACSRSSTRFIRQALRARRRRAGCASRTDEKTPGVNRGLRGTRGGAR